MIHKKYNYNIFGLKLRENPHIKYIVLQIQIRNSIYQMFCNFNFTIIVALTSHNMIIVNNLISEI